jgi:hypothetical protein
MNTSRISRLSALALTFGGCFVWAFGYQNPLASGLSLAGLAGWWYSQSHRTSKMALAGLVLSSSGLLFAASLSFLPYFHDLRGTDPQALHLSRQTWYWSGVMFFFGMFFALMVGLVLLGISSWRSASTRGAQSVFLVLTGLVSISPSLMGLLLAATGVTWVYSIRQRLLLDL